MAWEISITLSFIGTAFLLVYIAFNLETDDNVENQFLRLMLIAFAIIFSFAAVAANFGILDATGIPFDDSSKVMKSLNSAYIPFIILLVLLLVYTVWFVVKRIMENVKKVALIDNGEIEDDKERR